MMSTRVSRGGSDSSNDEERDRKNNTKEVFRRQDGRGRKGGRLMGRKANCLSNPSFIRVITLNPWER